MPELNHHQFNGKLTRVPFPHKPSAALARCMPLDNDNDFSVFSELPANNTPILINFIEHYEILSQLVTRANTLWPDSLTILIEISMPGGMRLPAPLLLDNVLLIQDASPEIKKLKGNTDKLLVIQDQFVRYQIEKGDNSFHISLFEQDITKSNTFSQFIAPLAELGIHNL